MAFEIDLTKQYQVKWDSEPYDDDHDLFLAGTVIINENKTFDITLGVTSCVFDPALSQESFIKFKVIPETQAKVPFYNLCFVPIEWESDPRAGGDIFDIEEVVPTENPNIYKIIEEEEEH